MARSAQVTGSRLDGIRSQVGKRLKGVEERSYCPPAVAESFLSFGIWQNRLLVLYLTAAFVPQVISETRPMELVFMPRGSVNVVHIFAAAGVPTAAFCYILYVFDPSSVYVSAK